MAVQPSASYFPTIAAQRVSSLPRRARQLKECPLKNHKLSSIIQIGAVEETFQNAPIVAFCWAHSQQVVVMSSYSADCSLRFILHVCLQALKTAGWDPKPRRSCQEAPYIMLCVRSPSLLSTLCTNSHLRAHPRSQWGSWPASEWPGYQSRAPWCQQGRSPGPAWHRSPSCRRHLSVVPENNRTSVNTFFQTWPNLGMRILDLLWKWICAIRRWIWILSDIPFLICVYHLNPPVSHLFSLRWFKDLFITIVSLFYFCSFCSHYIIVGIMWMFLNTPTHLWRLYIKQTGAESSLPAVMTINDY